MNIQLAINELLGRNDLNDDMMRAAMTEVMTGVATEAQIAGFLVALRMKGETVNEITLAAQVMRDLSSKVNVSLPKTVDTCGIGGYGSSVFNVSTASAFIAAAAGAKVAKHGNRSNSSNSGSADVLEAAGVNLELSPEQVARAVEQVGVGFMFAVKHHGAMKYAIKPRRELGVRTIFNVLGPLTNPAGSRHQVLGVYDKSLVLPMAQVLQKLGSEHVLVVHAEDGLDEFSIAASSHVAELKNGNISVYDIKPEDVGLEKSDLQSLVVNSATESLELIRLALTGKHKVAADMLAYNAGAAIYAADVTLSFAQGVSLAQDVIASGQALEKLNEFIDFTQMAGKA